MADAAELITRILDPIAFRANEDALLTSAQNRRVQQAESRRADRDQQLQEILAPLKLQQTMQELELNTLKLEQAKHAQDLQLKGERQVSDWLGLSGRIETIGIDSPEAVKSGYDWWSKHGSLLSTKVGQELYGDFRQKVEQSAKDKITLHRDKEKALNELEGKALLEQGRMSRADIMEQGRMARAQLGSRTRLKLEELRRQTNTDPRRRMAKIDFVRHMAQDFADDARVSLLEGGKLAEDYYDELTTAESATTPPSAPAAPTGPVRVTTPEEAMALPPGTQFVTPDGRVKVRP